MSDIQQARSEPPRESVPAQVVRDFIGIAGAVASGVGAWMHYPPLGLIVGGAMFFVLAIVGTIRRV